MNLKTLHIFLKTAELESFSAASRHLQLTPAAVSKSVAELEKTLGARLFHRSTRALSLTEDGKSLLQEITQPIVKIEEALNRSKNAESKPAGRLKINMSESFGKRFILPLIPAFSSAYPDLELDIEMQDKRINPIDEGFDVSIGNLANADTGLIARDLCKLQLVTITTPGYLASKARPRKPEDLPGHNLIAYRQLSTGRVVDWRYQLGGVSMSITPTGKLTLSNIDAVAESVKNGLGIGCVGFWHVQEAIEAGSVIELLRKFRPAPLVVKVYYSSRTHLPKKVRVFIDFLLTQAPQFPDC